MAIATFERTLSQQDTPLDRYLAGDTGALSAPAVLGKQLFEGKANCIECHNGPALTDEKYYNLGVPRPFEWEEMGLKGFWKIKGKLLRRAKQIMTQTDMQLRAEMD